MSEFEINQLAGRPFAVAKLIIISNILRIYRPEGLLPGGLYILSEV